MKLVENLRVLYIFTYKKVFYFIWIDDACFAITYLFNKYRYFLNTLKREMFSTSSLPKINTTSFITYIYISFLFHVLPLLLIFRQSLTVPLQLLLLTSGQCQHAFYRFYVSTLLLCYKHLCRTAMYKAW